MPDDVSRGGDQLVGKRATVHVLARTELLIREPVDFRERLPGQGGHRSVIGTRPEADRPSEHKPRI